MIDRIQIVAIVLSVLFLFAVLELVRRRKLIEEYSFLWIVVAVLLLAVSIWRELLHVQEVGLQDNFFDLGGHSLLVIGAQTRLRDALGIDLPIVRLFQYPTISALAGFINDRAARLDGSKDRGRRKQAAYRRVPNREQEQLA